MMLLRMTAGDTERVLAAQSLFERPRLDSEAIGAFLRDERNYLLMALVEEQPAGFLLAYELPRLDTPRRMVFLYELGVAPEHRRRGVGQALVQEMARLCRDNGGLKMFVLTKEDNAPARALYAATGGEPSTDDIMYWYQFKENGQ